MKLRNKKTGEIVSLEGELLFDNEVMLLKQYNSLAELNEEWEDYEEPESTIKDVWFNSTIANGHFVEIDFISDEEAEKAVEKLKAWKRLKDGGITFKNWTINQTGTIDCFATWGNNIPPSRKNPTLLDDLDLLFGGEE